VIFLSAYGDIPTTVRAMRGGALDFLTKPVTTAELLKMRAPRAGARRGRPPARARLAEVRERFATLTPRERQVMAGVVAGRLNKQICYALQLAERTVKTHRARVMEKMSVRSVAELVRAHAAARGGRRDARVGLLRIWRGTMVPLAEQPLRACWAELRSIHNKEIK
jgi:FixJ family two-component response regulator